VASALVAEGWQILGENVRAATGELDLVAARDGCWRFVEVKARTAGDDGLLSIGRDKQRRLRAAGEAWLADRGPPPREVAFLVALVHLERAGWPIEWWDDAF
jgi:Holliday junction resolvase-like predicted endonuclease